MGENIFQLNIIRYETETQVRGMGCDVLSHWPKISHRHSSKYHSLLPQAEGKPYSEYHLLISITLGAI